MDAWEILQSHSSSAGDAWSLINNITGGGVPGLPINELSFTLQPVLSLSGSVAPMMLSGSIAASSLTGAVGITGMSGSIEVQPLTGSIVVEDI